MDTGSNQNGPTAPHFINGLVKIIYEPEKSLAQVHWLGFYTSSAYREAMQACLDLNKNERVGKWIVNNINLSRISAEDQEWTASHLFPQLDTQLLQKIGLIVSKDLYTKMVIETTLEKSSTRSPFEIQFFDDMSTAIAWIQEE